MHVWPCEVFSEQMSFTHLGAWWTWVDVFPLWKYTSRVDSLRCQWNWNPVWGQWLRTQLVRNLFGSAKKNRVIKFYHGDGTWNKFLYVLPAKCIKDPLRCKLQIYNTIIEQVLSFNYLGVQITSLKDLNTEVRHQAIQASKISGCLNETIWFNRHLRNETKVRIYKSFIRPILTYAAETRTDTAKTT